MIKLGKPEIGYGATRNLTRRESMILGLPKTVIIMHEHGTGLITFWYRYRNGLNSYPLSGDSIAMARNALDNFWLND